MYTFIVNPNAKSGRGSMIWDLIEPELKKRRIEYEAFFTQHACHASEIAAEVTSDDREHVIVVLGGDGTVNEVINGIRHCGKVTLGYIPAGSGNDFTRVLKLPSDPERALENILNPQYICTMDVGKISFKNKENFNKKPAYAREAEHRFAVSTGIGFDAAVCHQVAVSKLKIFLNKLGLGRLTYAGVALLRLFGDPAVHMEITLDHGEKKVFQHAYFAAVMNHPYEGGGFFFCPEAKIDDGVFDVIVAADIPKWKILFLLPTAFFGKHVKYKGVYIYRSKYVKIETAQMLPIHTDGEPVADGTCLEAEVLDEQIRIFTNVKVL